MANSVDPDEIVDNGHEEHNPNSDCIDRSTHIHYC